MSLKHRFATLDEVTTDDADEECLSINLDNVLYIRWIDDGETVSTDIQMRDNRQLWLLEEDTYALAKSMGVKLRGA